MRHTSRFAILFFLLVCGRASADTVAPVRPITSHDRVLVIAPHPDDESLGAGGLIQRAVEAHAHIRVVFLTNGDNNVWAQRFIEHRVVVGPSDKARWGARRDKEAVHALATLGVPAKAIVFLDFHDCDTTRLLMTNSQPFRGAIDSAVISWQPTVLVIPSPDDLHPDHNTAYVITHLEYSRLNVPLPYELDYLVHTEGPIYEPDRLELALTTAEKQTQLAAILCHWTQMVLGRKRFSAYAKDVETFYPPKSPAEIASHHPLCEGKVEHGVLRLTICRANTGGLRGASIDVAIQTAQGDAIRLQFPVPPDSGDVPVTNSITRQQAGTAAVRSLPDRIQINAPLSSPAGLRMGFVKLDWAPVFFDTAGWRALPVNETVR